MTKSDNLNARINLYHDPVTGVKCHMRSEEKINQWYVEDRKVASKLGNSFVANDPLRIPKNCFFGRA